MQERETQREGGTERGRDRERERGRDREREVQRRGGEKEAATPSSIMLGAVEDEVLEEVGPHQRHLLQQ